MVIPIDLRQPEENHGAHPVCINGRYVCHVSIRKSQSPSSRVAPVVSAPSFPLCSRFLASSPMASGASSFTLALAVRDGVTFSLSLTGDSANGGASVGHFASQVSLARNSIRDAVLESLALNPYQQAWQSVPQTTTSVPDGVTVEPRLDASTGSANAPDRARGRNGVDQYRLQRARRAGDSAAAKLRWESEAVPATPELELPLASRFYVVLRSSDESPPTVYSSWKQCKKHVLAVDHNPPVLAAGAVFHGFPSWTEIAEYCKGAGVELPPHKSM